MRIYIPNELLQKDYHTFLWTSRAKWTNPPKIALILFLYFSWSCLIRLFTMNVGFSSQHKNATLNLSISIVLSFHLLSMVYVLVTFFNNGSTYSNRSSTASIPLRFFAIGQSTYTSSNSDPVSLKVVNYYIFTTITPEYFHSL